MKNRFQNIYFKNTPTPTHSLPPLELNGGPLMVTSDNYVFMILELSIHTFCVTKLTDIVKIIIQFVQPIILFSFDFLKKNPL